MKKHNGIKVTLIISIICVIIGAFCIGMGIVQNGDIAYLRVDNQTAPWWPFHGSFGIHLEEVAEDISKTKTFSQTFDDVDKLELNVRYVWVITTACVFPIFMKIRLVFLGVQIP